MKKVEVKPIIFATSGDVSNIELIAAEFVAEFNAKGSHQIINWKTRNPTQQEINLIQNVNRLTVTKESGTGYCYRTKVKSEVKTVFVLEPTDCVIKDKG